MKSSLSLFLLALLILASCKKEDKSPFDKSPDQRLNEALTAYQNQLTGAVNGWKAFIYPKSGGTYFFYFKFNDQNRVKMYSTFDSTSAVTPRESSYRLKALQQPSLIFDTYSYVHVLADPNELSPVVIANVNGGTVGKGLQSDFEFYFDSTSTDTIKLVGRFNGSRAVLVKATQQEAASYDNKELGRGFVFQNIGKYLNYFKRATIGGVTYEINVNLTARIITLSWLDGSGNLQTFSTPFYFSGTGVNFINPLVNGSQTITGFTNITWNAATTTLSFSVNGSPTTVVGLGQPLKVDLGAPQRFKQYAISEGSFWYSVNGWHINGVDDALNFQTQIRNYNFVLYSPKEIGLFGWTAGDLGVVIYDNGNSILGSSYTSTISNGIIKFVIQGGNTTLQAGTALPAAQANLVVGASNSFRSYMTDPAGYYMVQTGPLSYDMVNANDGKSWISWEW